MQTDPELLDEVRDPIAEDEVEVVETAEVNERLDGEENVSNEGREDSDPLGDAAELEPGDESEVTIADAEGPETET